ncbi:unnamed protein product [Candida verbasci]|uniref:Ribosome-releasing factor 2, mitochondrial n=1 Tax=Candida verbasci TaxID=1227364 RepID=A0A9W4TTW2_9ASCO|nr:unnamed protein product [Candida verbasci]
MWSSNRYKSCIHLLSRCYSKVNNIQLPKTRNIGIIAHIDAGKTTTTERMIYYSGKTNRMGNVDEGDTVTDYLPSERERGITIQLAAITLPWNQHKINIIDTPGHADFTFEVIRSLRVLDGVVTILDGVAGVEAQTEKVWKQAKNLNLPKIAYINKMDRLGAGFSRTVEEIIQKLETRVVLCNLPYFEVSKENDLEFKGVIDVIHKKLLKWKTEDKFGKEIDVFEIDENHESFEPLCKSRESMVETLGEYDESIIDSFLENDEDYLKIPSQLLDKVIRKATIDNYVTPVFCGSSFRNIGVQPLMDAITKYLPSPLETDIPEIKNKKSKQVVSKFDQQKGLIVDNNSNLTLSLAFKVMTHATRGPMTFVRVYSGKLNSNSNLINLRTGKKILIKKLLIMHGDNPEEVKSISAGNIGVIPGYEFDFQTGDTLISSAVGKQPVNGDYQLLPIEVPPPLFNSSLQPHTAGDEAHMKKCVDQLVREDPSLKVFVDEEMGQTILSGMGELHLEIVRDRLVRDMKAKCTLKDVVVSYKETFTSKKGIEEGKFANEGVEVSVTMEPIENAKDFTGENATIIEEDNNVIIIDEPSSEIKEAIEQRRWKCPNSIEEIKEAIINGCLASLQMGGPVLGFALHSVLIRVNYWNLPIEENKDQISNFLNASRQAVQFIKQDESDFGILEPIMKTKVYVDSNDLGEVSHDLTQRCSALILGVEDESMNNIETFNWANEESEKIYLPPDYTLKNTQSSNFNIINRKLIIAETPLKEMIGYLSKLRSLTQGRSTFDMTFIGMRRVVGNRLDTIIKNM